MVDDVDLRHLFAFLHQTYGTLPRPAKDPHIFQRFQQTILMIAARLFTPARPAAASQFPPSAALSLSLRFQTQHSITQLILHRTLLQSFSAGHATTR